MRVARSNHGVAILLLLAAPATAMLKKPPTVADLKKAYIDGIFEAKPHLATFMGDHRFDAQLPDLSDAALAAREKQLASQQEALDKLDRKKLTVDDRIDAEIMDDGIGLELLYLREIRDWTWDPRLHDSFPYYDPREIVAGRLSDIIHGDYAPEAERRTAVVAQLGALPRFLDQMKAALKTPSKIYLDQAVKDNQGRIEFFDSEVKDFVKGDKEGEVARAKAVAALQQYQTFLVKDLPPRATRDWKLGAALYRKKFPLALQTKLTTDEVIPRAEKVFAESRAELSAVAARLHDQLWPKEPKAAFAKLDAAQQKALINRVKDEIAKDHPKPAELVQAHGKNLDKLRAFIEKNDLLALPPKESLSVTAMPLFKRGSSAAEYLAPGILDKRGGFKATYYVDPIDPTWKPEKVESYLRGQNDYEVELVASHEAYPGHHTQFFYERKDLNPLRAVLWNGAMVEGWAVYGEGLMVRLGYGGEKSDRYRFCDARGRMIVATNILIDIKLQSGIMPDAEAVRFMVEEGFQEQAQAEKKLLRAKLDSTQLAQYFLGLDEIERLEADHRKKVGVAFKQRTFNEALIGHGSIAVRHLRTYLMGE
ncbi:MAG: DUF885 domain-containing protein [Myxococcales bacterium]|nr:DUF885 domain-containing protein [Myxococcales bacterium]